LPYLVVEKLVLFFIGIKVKAANVEHCRLSLELIHQIFVEETMW
jgi:hypothetical protein